MQQKGTCGVEKCAHHLFSSFSQVGMCWPCLCLLSLMKYLQGFSRPDEKNALKADEREFCAGSSSTSQRKFSVSKVVCFVTSGRSSERRGKHVLPSKWWGPSSQTPVGKNSWLVVLLPSHEKTDAWYGLLKWNSSLLPLVKDLHISRRLHVSPRNQLYLEIFESYLMKF